jgi:hypothetical protein
VRATPSAPVSMACMPRLQLSWLPPWGLEAGGNVPDKSRLQSAARRTPPVASAVYPGRSHSYRLRDVHANPGRSTVTAGRDMLQIGACTAARAAMTMALTTEAGFLWNQF